MPELGKITPGSAGAEIDPKVWHPTDELVIKKAPSAFFGTPVASILRYWDVDTVVVLGCMTSGCIRASIVDAFSHGLRTIVVGECCGDQQQEAHRANLADVGRRYADVVGVDEAVAGLEAIAGA